MPFLAAPLPPPELPRLVRTESRSRQAADMAFNGGKFTGQEHLGIFSRELSEISCGQHRYELRQPIAGRLMPNFDRLSYRFTSDSLPGIVGVGATRPEATLAFESQFHSRFQELLAKRPFEMSDRELHDWRAIHRVFDVEGYRRSRPIIMRRYGIALNDQGRHAVQWEGRPEKEVVDLGIYPPDFPAFITGQPFEAFLELDPVSRRPTRVFYVKKSSPANHRTQADNAAFWDSLPGTSSLPASKFD